MGNCSEPVSFPPQYGTSPDKREHVLKEDPLEMVLILSAHLVYLLSLTVALQTQEQWPLLLPLPTTAWAHRARPFSSTHGERQGPVVHSWIQSSTLKHTPQEKGSHSGLSKCPLARPEQSLGICGQIPSTCWQLTMTRSHPCLWKPTLPALACVLALGLSRIPLKCRLPERGPTEPPT